MARLTFAEAEYATKKRKTHREVFLEKMDALISWKQLEKKLSKPYHKGRTGRPPYPLSTMLRVHCLQLFYNLSDPAMEDALYGIESMRRFAGLRLSERIPDQTTILNFRHFLESRRLGKVIFDTVNRHLADAGLMLKEARKALPRGHAVPRGSAHAHVDGWHLQGRTPAPPGSFPA